MNARTLSQLTVVCFLLVGTLGIALRHSSRESMRRALDDSLWLISYNVKFRAEGDETNLSYAIPFDDPHVTVESQEWGDLSDLNPRVRRLTPSRTRERVFSTRLQGDFEVRPKFTLRVSPGAKERFQQVEHLSADGRARYLREETTLNTRLAGVRSVVQQANEACTTEQELVQWFFNYCSRTLVRAEEATDNSVLTSLTNNAATPLGRVRTMVTLCRAAGIPARIVTGFEARQTDKLEPHVWVEVFRDHHWAPFDPEYGYSWRMPDNFVTVRRGGEQIVRSDRDPQAGASAIVKSFTIERLDTEEEALRNGNRGPTSVFDLTRLPLEMQKILSLLLLLPFGALITAVFRNVIGVMTFGTFAPALFAVSFIDSDWSTGLVILVVVIAAGLSGRVFLDRLRLLMVPRLSIILTTIVLFVVLGVSALDYLRVTPSAQAVLLPLVILTILIERFFVTTEEDSLSDALKLVAGTLVVSGVCYAVLQWEVVGQAILIYPEAHFLTIAAFIIIGRYTGYRVAEMWRFRDLVNPEPLDP